MYQQLPMTLDKRCSEFSAVTRSLFFRGHCSANTCAVPVKCIFVLITCCCCCCYNSKLLQSGRLAIASAIPYTTLRTRERSACFDLYRTWKGALHDDGGGGACDGGRGACGVTYVYSSSGVSSCADPIKTPCHTQNRDTEGPRLMKNV